MKDENEEKNNNEVIDNSKVIDKDKVKGKKKKHRLEPAQYIFSIFLVIFLNTLIVMGDGQITDEQILQIAITCSKLFLLYIILRQFTPKIKAFYAKFVKGFNRFLKKIDS